MTSTVEFESHGDELHQLYSPRDDAQWVHDKFNQGKELVCRLEPLKTVGRLPEFHGFYLEMCPAEAAKR